MLGYGKNMKVILYDEDEMKCFGGYLSGITMEDPQAMSISLDGNCRFYNIGHQTAEIVVEMDQQIIQLDPTTMKRIARFNLEKENEELVNEIEEHKKNIEALKAEYRELNERLQSIRDIGADIWENGTEYKKDDDDWEL